MDNEVFRCEDRLDQVIMPEIDGVGEEKHFGGAIDNVESEEVVEGRSDVETMVALEVPGLVGDGFLWMTTPQPAGPMGVAL